MSLIDEIREQPEAAARFLDRQEANVRSVASLIGERDIAFVLIAARGTSDHAAIYAQYAFGLRNRLAVALAAPSTVSVYGSPPRLDRALVIGISQSGQSPDIVGVVEDARRQGAATVAVTNAPGSPLAAAAHDVIPVEAGPELAVAATKTYTMQLLALATLSAALAGWRSEDERALRRVPETLAAALESSEPAKAIADRHPETDRAIVLGRGFEYATAREWALKLQEMAHVLAHPFSAADFEHGPVALLEPGFPLLAVVPDDAAGAELLPLLRRLQAEHSPDLVVVSPRRDAADLVSLPVPATLPPWLAPVATIVPGQLFAYHLTRAKGLDTEAPRTISKVTLTR